MRFITLEETGSTNTWVAGNLEALNHLDFVSATRQSAGRGQRGNTWESEPGANLTFSVLLRMDEFPARCQFQISEAVALSIVDTLRHYGVEALVKWPNDIYVGHSKICGILIEHAVMGSGLMHSIAGAGLNVNQLRFVSDAPNPVSMAQIAGHSFDLKEVRDVLASKLGSRIKTVESAAGREAIHREFLSTLYRGDGAMHLYRDRDTGDRFEASIAGVEPLGFLLLTDSGGATRRYAFKEVEFLLPEPR